MWVNPKPQERKHKELHGTMRALIANMVTGVSTGFQRKMQIFGTGLQRQGTGRQARASNRVLPSR